MSHEENEIDSPDGVGLNDLVFDDKNHERCLRKLCNSTLPQSKVVYYY